MEPVVIKEVLVVCYFSSLISWPAFLYLYLHLSYFVSSEERKKIPQESLSFERDDITENLFLSLMAI